MKSLMANLPRADIENDVIRIMKKVTNKKEWQTRKEGAQDLITLLEAKGMRVKSKGLGDLFSAIKARLGEKNKALLKIYIQLSGKLAEAVGKEIGIYMAKYLKSLMWSIS